MLGGEITSFHKPTHSPNIMISPCTARTN